MIETSAIKGVRTFFTSSVWCLLLMGATGTGKTYAAEFALGRITERWRQSYYNRFRSPPDHDDPKLVLATELARRLFDRVGERTFVDVTKEAGALVLDDLGIEHIGTTGAFLSALDEILNYRHHRSMRTIITTNLTRDELRERYGPRIYDRLRDGIAVECSGDSLRGRKTKENDDATDG